MFLRFNFPDSELICPFVPDPLKTPKQNANNIRDPVCVRVLFCAWSASSAKDVVIFPNKDLGYFNIIV